MDFRQERFNLNDALNTAGRMYLEGRYADAESILSAQEKISPDAPEIYYNLAILASIQGQFSECARLCRRALEIDPDNHNAKDLLSHQLLREGRWLAGFELFESRFHKPYSIPAFHCGRPLWDGAEGQRVLVTCEQGLGDTVQFTRLLDAVRARNCKVILLAQKELCDLFFESEIADEVYFSESVMSGAISSDGKTKIGIIPEFLDDRKIDSYITIMSLARVLKITPDRIPGKCPFLKVARARAEGAARVLESIFEPALPRVGLVWAGSTSPHREFQKMDQRRSVPLRCLHKLLELNDVSFLSLQKGSAARECLEYPRIKALPLTDSYADTAALLLNLDLLITVDTSICHVAGALGVPVWLMNRYDSCWRWFETKADSPWYPTLKIFRQESAGDWSSVADSLLKSVEKLNYGAVIANRLPILPNRF